MFNLITFPGSRKRSRKPEVGTPGMFLKLGCGRPRFATPETCISCAGYSKREATVAPPALLPLLLPFVLVAHPPLRTHRALPLSPRPWLPPLAPLPGFFSTSHPSSAEFPSPLLFSWWLLLLPAAEFPSPLFVCGAFSWNQEENQFLGCKRLQRV